MKMISADAIRPQIKIKKKLPQRPERIIVNMNGCFQNGIITIHKSLTQRLPLITREHTIAKEYSMKYVKSLVFKSLRTN